MLCDALGLPLKFIITPGQDSDFTQALNLLEGETGQYVVADKGYDGDNIVAHIETDMSAQAVIPSKCNRHIQRQHDQIIYKERNMIERLFNKLKQFRRLATRYCKAKIHFQAFISIACAWLWLN